MARYIGPVCRLCRREGIKLFLKGERCYTDKCAIERRGYPPGQHGQGRGKKATEYSVQLREKQKLKRIYGMFEAPFRRIFALAERHLSSPHREVRNLATALFEHNERLFTFLEQEGVEPTNNSAERALRTGVQWRKICFGNRSAHGELATARLLTVAETCDLQRLNILAYLAAAIASHRKRQPAASLLPR